ncbi:MAG TPA: hypothetical protein VHS31_02940 [Tepidisphaeraceae bacterium]|jgi:hypothetical protein|nr:hypothetical protein [Tepidisphaeraceae bacterium]
MTTGDKQAKPTVEYQNPRTKAGIPDAAADFTAKLGCIAAILIAVAILGVVLYVVMRIGLR